MQYQWQSYNKRPSSTPPDLLTHPMVFSLSGCPTKQKRICARVRSLEAKVGRYLSLYLGLPSSFVFGAMLILTSLLLDTVVGFIRHQFHWKEHKKLQWTLDEKLQLQPMAYEEAGQGHWSGGASSCACH